MFYWLDSFPQCLPAHPSSIRVWVQTPPTVFLIFYAELILNKSRDFFFKKMTHDYR
jgi:hypothetical protein